MRLLKVCLLFLVCGLSGADRQAAPGVDLQDLVRELAPGDRLIVTAGEYRGNLLLDRPLEVIGTGYPRLHGNGSGDVVRITAAGVLLSGFDIQGSGTRLLKDDSGIKIEGDDVKVTDCRISDILHGIYVKGANRVILRNNTIVGRGNLQEALRGNGIHLWNTRGNLVEHNRVTSTRDGIYFSFADESSVVDNHIHAVRYGLHYMYSDDNHFDGNLFEHNVAGAALMYSKRIHFSRNVFAHNRGYRSYGVLYQSCEFCTAFENLITDNTRGIFFDDSNFNLLQNNDVTRNDIAVTINASCEENILAGNNFLDNLSNLVMDARGYPNHWSEAGRGNHWSGYRGVDLNGDGLGDQPYELQSVFEFLEADHPEVRLYLHSPAAQALEMAERSLPILLDTAKEDPFPVIKPLPNPVPQPDYTPGRHPASLLYASIYALGVVLPLVVMRRFRA